MILYEMAAFSVLKRERRKQCEYTLKLNLSKLKNQTNIYLAQNPTCISSWPMNWSDYIIFAWEEWKVANMAPIFKKRVEGDVQPAAKTIQVRH